MGNTNTFKRSVNTLFGEEVHAQEVDDDAMPRTEMYKKVAAGVAAGAAAAGAAAAMPAAASLLGFGARAAVPGVLAAMLPGAAAAVPAVGIPGLLGTMGLASGAGLAGGAAVTGGALLAGPVGAALGIGATALAKTLWDKSREKSGTNTSGDDTPALGKDELRSIRKELETQVARLGDELGLQRVLLGHVASMAAPSVEGESPDQQVRNVLMFSLVDPDAHPRRQIDPASVEDWVEVCIHPDTAYAEYVVEYFKSPLGQLTRQWLFVRAMSERKARLAPEMLQDCPLYLPPVDQQTHVLNTHRAIHEVMVQLTQHQAQLWTNPSSVAEIDKAIETASPTTSFQEWLGTFPFPLASVLWRYHAESDAIKRYQVLLKFFEAVTMFTVTVMLSAMESDPEYFKECKAKWNGRDPSSRIRLARSSFGTWVTLGRKVAKSTRSLLRNSPLAAEYCSRLYRTRNVGLLQVLSDERLFDLLDKARQYRNQWVGHGGIEGPEEAQRRLALLENLLSDLRMHLGNALDDLWLIQPETMECRSGRFYNKVRLLKGTYSYFQRIDLETEQPLDADRLYVVDRFSGQVLPLMPIFRMMPYPQGEDRACYFYNRLEDGGVRWVSYHVESPSEMVEPDPLLMTSLGDFLGG